MPIHSEERGHAGDRHEPRLLLDLLAAGDQVRVKDAAESFLATLEPHEPPG